MEKSEFKKYLHIFDKIESNKYQQNNLYKTFLVYLNEDDKRLNQEEFSELFQALFRLGNIVCYEKSFDLSEPLYIFARSSHHSALEALSLFEALIQNQKVRCYIEEHLTKAIRIDIIDHYFLNIVKNTLLFKESDHGYFLNPQWIYEYQWILEDVKEHLNCSDCLKTYYTHQLYTHVKLLFRNEDVPVIPYRHQQDMKKIFPTAGIPVDRDCSKDLQVFFKDCLFNEFKHSCCICNASLPQMLIASHIKPFRDCGYLIEAMDANNGLLLCRNHDYLFDQGYVSFDDSGKIMITSELLDEASTYQLDPHFQLDQSHLSESRKLFLNYHRNHIYKNNKNS